MALHPAQVPKAKGKGNGKAGTKDTSKADHGGDNATEAGVAPKRKASNGVADSEAPKKRPAAKGHRSRARNPVPATEDEATTMEVEPNLEPELEPQVSGDAFGATEVSGVEVSAEVSEAMELETKLPEVVSEVSGLATSDFDSVDNTSGGGAAAGTVAEVPGVPVPKEEATPMELETKLPEVVSEVAGVSGVTTSDFDSVDNTSQKKPELHGQEAPVTPVNDGKGSSQATTLILGQTPPPPKTGKGESSKGEEPKVSDDGMPEKPIFAARYCTGSADCKLFWTRLQRIFNELAPEDERLRETERAAWKFAKENNDNSFKRTEDRMKELTIQFFEMWAAKRQA